MSIAISLRSMVVERRGTAVRSPRGVVMFFAPVRESSTISNFLEAQLHVIGTTALAAFWLTHTR